MPVKEPVRIKIPQSKGRPLMVVVDRGKQPVMDGEHYLAWHARTKRFYIGRTDPRRYLGSDLDAAILAYRQIIASLGKETVQIARVSNVPLDAIESHFELRPELQFELSTDGEVAVATALDSAYVWHAVRAMFHQDPVQFRRDFEHHTGTPIQTGHPTDGPTKLVSLGKTYQQDKKGRIGDKELANSAKWWREFCAQVRVATVADLDEEAVRRYRDTVEERQEKLKRQNAYTINRFGKVKTIISWGLSELKMSESDRSMLEQVRRMLKPPPRRRSKKVEIEPAELQAILAVSDDWDKALILVALNAAYYPIDCQRLTWDMIDLNKCIIRHDREKAEKVQGQPIPRICSLWNRTAAALKKIGADSGHVFLSSQRRPAHVDTLNDHFVRRCREAKLNRRLVFKNLRQSALTAAYNAVEVHGRQIELLAGHSAGIKDHYVVRKSVKLACDAIERHYFE